jgi:hypothetical protein
MADPNFAALLKAVDTASKKAKEHTRMDALQAPLRALRAALPAVAADAGPVAKTLVGAAIQVSRAEILLLSALCLLQCSHTEH